MHAAILQAHEKGLWEVTILGIQFAEYLVRKRAYYRLVAVTNIDFGQHEAFNLAIFVPQDMPH